MIKTFTTYLVACLFLSGCTVIAEDEPGSTINADSKSPVILSARESDPNVMGWMQGFPPPAHLQISQPDANYFSFPKLRWSVCHLREFLPTEAISRGLGAPIPLAYALDDQIDQLTFTPMNSDELMT